MPNEARPRRGVVAVVDALGAIVRTELACARALWSPSAKSIPADVANAFDEKVTVLGGDLGAAGAALEACEAIAEGGGRAAAIVSASSLADARRALARLVERRRAVVVHAIVAPRGAPLSSATYADVHALGELGVGILVARDAQDASDLALIAHRAAEDAEAPIVVVHDGFPSTYARERVVLPDAPLVRAALEATPSPHTNASDDATPPHRRAAARIPFALASAMRVFERLTGRKIEPIEAHGTANAELAIVAAGSISETARAVIERGRTHEPPLTIGVVQLVALRPFPGPQLVKALGRARRVAVIDHVDTPLAQSNPLATEVKAAFADALTWTPGYSGVGRIPEIFAGSVEPSTRATSPAELLAVVDNLLLGEQGRRVFHLGGDHPASLVASTDGPDAHPAGSFSIRLPHDPSLLVHLLSDLFASSARATPHAGNAHGGDAFDLTVADAPIRAHHGATSLDLVVVDAPLDDPAAISQLRDGGALALLGPLEHLGAKLRAELRARNAVVYVLPAAKDPLARDASLVGAILRARTPSIDRKQALVEAERSLRASSPALGDVDVKRALDALDAAFVSTERAQLA